MEVGTLHAVRYITTRLLSQHFTWDAALTLG